MIRVGCREVIGHMAIGTIDPQWLEIEQRSRRMAILAVGGGMSPKQGKAAEPMNVDDVLHQPGVRGMAPSAIQSNCLFMDVGVAGHAFGICLGEDQ